MAFYQLKKVFSLVCIYMPRESLNACFRCSVLDGSPKLVCGHFLCRSCYVCVKMCDSSANCPLCEETGTVRKLKRRLPYGQVKMWRAMDAAE